MSIYRDDGEALQQRIVQLRNELDEERRRSAQLGQLAPDRRTRQVERQLGSMERDLAKLRAEVRHLRGAETPKKGSFVLRTMLAFAAGSAVIGGVSALFVKVSRPTPSRPIVLVTTPVSTITTPPKPIETAPTRIAPESPPRRSTVKAQWKATVRRAEGITIAPGAACTIEATGETSGTNAIVPALTVICGDNKIYDSNAPLNGMAQMDNDLREVLGASDDSSTYTIQYADVGTRSGSRAQIDLDSTRHEGLVFSERTPRFRVELTIPSESQPASPLGLRLRRDGKVTEVSGAAIVKPGAACVLRAMPTGQGESCVADVRCGSTILVAAEPIHCSYDNARPSTLTSPDTPGKLRITGDSLEIITAGASPSRVNVALSAAN